MMKSCPTSNSMIEINPLKLGSSKKEGKGRRRKGREKLGGVEKMDGKGEENYSVLLL